MAENLERRLKIAKEAIKLELDLVSGNAESVRVDIYSAELKILSTLHGFAEYLLEKGDSVGIAELIERGRERVQSAQSLLEKAPLLADDLSYSSRSFHHEHEPFEPGGAV